MHITVNRWHWLACIAMITRAISLFSNQFQSGLNGPPIPISISSGTSYSIQGYPAGKIGLHPFHPAHLRGTQRARMVHIHFTWHIIYRGAQQARMVHIHFTRHILYRVNQRARMVPHSNKKLFIKRCFNFKNIRIFAGTYPD